MACIKDSSVSDIGSGSTDDSGSSEGFASTDVSGGGSTDGRLVTLDALY